MAVPALDPEVILCDTSYVVQVARSAKRPEAVEHWPAADVDRLANAQLAISVITVAEVRVGTVRTTDRIRQAVEDRLATFTWIPLDMTIVDCWAELVTTCKEQGHGEPKHNDVWIAATAVSRGLPLVSCDIAQCRIPGLESIYLPRDIDSGAP